MRDVLILPILRIEILLKLRLKCKLKYKILKYIYYSIIEVCRCINTFIFLDIFYWR